MGTMTEGETHDVSQASSAAILILAALRTQQYGRETLICEQCGRGQFNKGQSSCIACHATLLLRLEPLDALDARPAKRRVERCDSLRICFRLRDLRRILDIPQPALADAIGCVRTHITKYETGRISPTIGFFDRAARALSITLAELLDETLSITALAIRSLQRSPGGGDLMQCLITLLPRLGHNSRATLLDYAKSLQKSPIGPRRGVHRTAAQNAA